MASYDHKKIEKKWQTAWSKKKVYKTEDTLKKPKFYILDMFPYPSGEGLHVGHPKGYIATDIVSRMKRMQGFNVLHPMGFDAFGLPAENYAIKTKTNPIVSVSKNVARYKKQLEILGFDYDWSREVNTTDPKYYKWTQWIFLKLHEKGLAYQSFEPINWCPSCKTGLANEDVVDGRCERCDSLVEKRPMRQWVIKITDYAEKLLEGLDTLDWPKSIKESQRNWIGRSEGAEIEFKIKNSESGIKVFTTRPDTLFGVTYVVLAPEHPLVTKLLEQKNLVSNRDEVVSYVALTKTKTDIERTDAKKEKTGLEIKGVRAIHPSTGEELPLFVADYVLADYGTGAVMAVPAHDERDFVFAKKFNLPHVTVISGGTSKGAFTEEGVLVNSGSFSGRKSEEVRKEITQSVKGKWVVKYKLKDWVFSRQRYWGEPFPILFDGDKVIPVSEKDLPVELPKVTSYEPTGTGESPLASISKWVHVKKDGKILKRETNTMPQWAGSSWYYLRYMDPKNDKALVDSDKEKYWNSVDLYVGGAEHATRHLIYARFWHKFLYDIGVVSTKEPFTKLQHVGLIMGEDGRKMSKRFGNVVNPDEIVGTYGADTLRLYESFMGPFDQQVSWSTGGIMGSRRFIERVWKLRDKVSKKESLSPEGDIVLHRTIHKVSEDIVAMRFNTAVSTFMIALNEFEKETHISREQYESFLKILAPFIPHVTEELWTLCGNKKTIHQSSWPVVDTSKLVSNVVDIGVQVNGKVRGIVRVKAGDSQDRVVESARAVPEIQKWLEGKKIVKIIYVAGKILNFVVVEPS
ncbi:MAG TPA: leucine--tRNA ligase [Candidatus Paceibacterota bacterium]|nr:leucine--tRNA ligase [Candidatus Paceibacterota bacterium]